MTDTHDVQHLRAELSKLESLAPRFSEGAISATQFNRMGKRAQAQYQRDMSRRYDVEDQIRELSKTPSQRAAEAQAQERKERESRLSQLDSFIQFRKLLKWDVKRKGSKMRVAYDDAVAERDTLMADDDTRERIGQ